MQGYTSMLSRAVDTLHIAMQESGQMNIDEKKSWKLNERHYGALTGLRKDEVKERLGSKVLARYRRDYDKFPVTMSSGHPLFNSIYSCKYFSDMPAREVEALPHGESLNACHDRVVEFLNESIFPSIRQGKTVIIAAHNNVLRALMMHLDEQDPRGQLGQSDIPKAIPIIYHLNIESLKVYFAL